MQRLPGARLAYVRENKIAEYLLDPDHPDNGGKAEFFLRFGFTREAPEAMRAALLGHAREGEVDEVEQTPFGPQYAVEGPLRTPDARDPLVRTVWLWQTEDEGPHLVTAYPSERRRGT